MLLARVSIATPPVMAVQVPGTAVAEAVATRGVGAGDEVACVVDSGQLIEVLNLGLAVVVVVVVVLLVVLVLDV